MAELWDRRKAVKSHPGALTPQRRVILIVEDDPQTRELYRQACSGAGYDVTAVADGIDALRRIEAEPPDAVVLDLQLPRLGGLDVYQELRANPRTARMPVIVVTGLDRPDLRRQFLRFFLKKPVSPEALIDAIDRAILAALEA